MWFYCLAVVEKLRRMCCAICKARQLPVECGAGSGNWWLILRRYAARFIFDIMALCKFQDNRKSIKIDFRLMALDVVDIGFGTASILLICFQSNWWLLLLFSNIFFFFMLEVGGGKCVEIIRNNHEKTIIKRGGRGSVRLSQRCFYDLSVDRVNIQHFKRRSFQMRQKRRS